MPLYDFECRACHHFFEALVRTGTVPECPRCHSQDLERQLSTFMMTSAEHNRELVRAERKKRLPKHKAEQHEEYQHALKEHLDHEGH
jgi:putative FmdB family regulatory protein